MDTETELKILAKIEALELLTTFTLASIYDLKGLSLKQVNELHEGLLEHAKNASASFLDPVESDHYCAECADALDRLLKVASDLRGAWRAPTSSDEE